jgi:hypothetical protein
MIAVFAVAVLSVTTLKIRKLSCIRNLFQLGAKYWTPRIYLEPESKNISRKILVYPKKILLTPLHIKLAIMKYFVKVSPKTGNCFKYFYKTCPHLSEAKL